MTPTALRDGTRTLARTAGVLALLNALLHLVEGPEYLEEEAYIGVLFFVGAALLAYAGVQLLRRPGDETAWLVAAVVSLGMLVSGLLSRTTGLPSFKEEEFEPTLLLAFLLELGVLACWGAHVSRRRRA